MATPPPALPAPRGYLNLSFGRLGASILVSGGTILAPRGHLGGPWEKQERQEEVRNQIRVIFRLVSRSFAAPIFGLKFGHLGQKKTTHKRNMGLKTGSSAVQLSRAQAVAFS